jgi:hypothetical protein
MQLLVTTLADGLQLPTIAIVDGQRQVGTIAQMPDVVDDAGLGVHAAPLALLALAVINREHLPAQTAPLRPGVELMLCSDLKKPAKLCEPDL